MSWDLKIQSEANDSDACASDTKPEDVEEVKLFISTFGKGEGFFDRDRWNGATISNGTWTVRGVQTPGRYDRFTLPTNLILTAGQDYYWGLKAKVSNRELVDDGEFSTPQIKEISSKESTHKLGTNENIPLG